MSSPVSILMAAIVLTSAVVPPAHASGTPASKCATAKQKAAVKKLGAKLKCYQKASADGVPVDGACLTTAETKFDAAIAKADAKGGCLGGDQTKIEGDVDACLLAIRTDTPDAQPTCGSSAYPQCGGTCPANMECRPAVREDVGCGGNMQPPTCDTLCRCVDPATSCNGNACSQICDVFIACTGPDTERCCSDEGGPCGVNGSQCCCGTCVQQTGSIGTCLGGNLACDASHTATQCQ